ncbi:MAG: LamG-like jellyroll fold domain-containing protein [Verrucomicrobiia bacterium]
MRKVLISLLAVFGVALCHSHQARGDYASTVAGLNPVAYYRFSNTNAVPAEYSATNSGSLGPSFHGEYQAMALLRAQPGAIAGDPNTAAATQTGSRVVVPFDEAYNPEGAFTVEAWLKPASIEPGVTSALNSGHMAEPRSGWILYQNGADGWSFRMYNQNGLSTSVELAGGGPVTADSWHHVVITYDGSTARLFVNGAEAVTGQPSGTPKAFVANTDGPFVIGARSDFAYPWAGAADEVALYTSALSASDVLAHYQNGTNPARTQPYDGLVLSKNPALYYRLGEPNLELPIAVNSGSYGSSANGTFMPGTTTKVPGLQQQAAPAFDAANTAAGFNGTSGAVQIPGWSLNTDAATMVAWVKRDGVQPARAGILHNRGPNTLATGMAVSDDGLSLSYCWEDKGETYNYNPGFILPDQAWTFVAFTVSAENGVLFMGTADGLKAATNNYANLPHDFSGATVEIGWDNYQPTRVFRGAIDEFAIFDRTLSYDEVAQMFNAAVPAILGVSRTPADPIYEGMDVKFTATVSGPSPSYQWRKNGSNLDGETAAALNVWAVVTASSGDYDVQVTTGGQALTSLPQPLEVLHSPPILTKAPVSAVRMVNGAVTFAAVVQGSQPFTYQWKHGNEIVPGRNIPALSISDLREIDAGDYTFTVTNPYGSAEATVSLTVVTPSKLSAAVTALGPIGYWRLDETTGTTAYDYCGGSDGTANNGVTIAQTGPRPSAFAGFDASNTAYKFDGGAGKVVIPPVRFNGSAATIAAWIYPDGVQADYAGIVFSRGTAVSGLDFKGSTEQLGYHWNDTSSTHQWDSGLYPAQNQWNFVAMVVEPTQGTLYLDSGTGLQTSVNEVDHGPSVLDGIQLGQDGASGRLFKGMIDEVIIFDRALSETEINVLRTAATSGTVSPAALKITEQPRSETVMAGTAWGMGVKAAGSLPITYQWQKNGQDIPGAIRSEIRFADLSVADSGVYRCVVSQGTTTLASSEATLTVKPVPTHLNIPQDLVLHLKFDGNYSDASGKANNGTAQGAPQIVAGKIGSGAVRCSTVLADGAVAEANYVTLGTPADLQFGASTSFSVAFWTKFTGGLPDLPFLCNNTDSYGGAGFVFAPSYGTGSWSWSLNDGSAPTGWPGVAAQYGNEAGYANAISDGQWHHLVFVVDRAGDVTVYMDGAWAHRKPIAGLQFNPDTGLAVNIGQGANGDYPVSGSLELDDLGVWRRALSKYDAEAIYVVGNGYGRSFDTEGPATVTLAWEASASGLVLTWSAGTLESADTLAGPWTAVTGASAPTYTAPLSGTGKFFRVRVQ